MLSQVTKDLVNLPVTLAEVKTHLRVETADDDTYINELINAALGYVEHETGRDYTDTTWDLILPTFPDVIELPRPPLKSVTSVTYFDADNTSQTVASSDYYLVKPSQLPASLTPVEDWPVTYDRPDAVTVRFVSGYSSVPEQVKHAIKLMVAHWYESREAVVVGTITKELELGVQRLTDQLRSVYYK